MNIEDLKNKASIKPLKLSNKETPHIVIEPTMECNISCRICYNLSRGHTKTLDQVKREIDLAISKRNLDTISILGGEPTLHPDLADIIAYIKSRNLHCQLLTNGILFLSDKDDTLLNKIVEAGVNRIILHVDVGQKHGRHFDFTVTFQLCGVAAERNQRACRCSRRCSATM